MATLCSPQAVARWGLRAPRKGRHSHQLKLPNSLADKAISSGMKEIDVVVKGLEREESQA